ncbi:MAG: 23S rRNA (pseudouridine(1915)-N(3))-methyltransferase RlmH [Pseudomonadota bacterium]
MRITVAAVGAAQKSAVAPLIDDYAARITRAAPSVGFKSFAIKEIDASRARTTPERKADEAARLRRAIGDEDAIVVLDEHGKTLSSAAFADWLAARRDSGTKRTSFLLGGADGLDESLINGASLQLALGRMTWPHLLARALIVEQLYRAVTILSGHPYHRE